MTRLSVCGAAALAAILGGVPAAHAAAPHTNIRLLSATQSIRVHNDGSWSRTVSRIVEPLTIAGVQSASQIEISYPANFATVKILSAYTETTAHKRIPVQPSEIFTQSTPDALKAPFLSDGQIKNVIFPAVTPGATIHLRYRIDYKHPYLPGIYALSTVLEPKIPADKVSLSLTTPIGTPLYVHTRGSWSKHSGQRAQGIHHEGVTGRWTAPSYPPPHTVSATQYAPMAVVTTARDWQAIASAYDKLAEPAMKTTPAIRSVAARVAGDTTGRAAVERLYHWLQQHIQAVPIDYALAGYAPPAAPDTLQHGMGDSNASTALLCALLRARGIEAAPAMLSESARYVPYPGAAPSAFGHFLVYVPAYHLFLDTSARFAGTDALPLADQGKPVLITGTHATFTTTPAPALHSIEQRQVEALRLTPAGDLEGSSTVRLTGWIAGQARSLALQGHHGPRLQHYLIDQFYRQGAVGSLKLVGLENRTRLDKPLTVKTTWQRADTALSGRAGLSVALPACATMDQLLSPFVSQSTRTAPSVLEPGTFEFVQHVRLPQGEVPYRLPGDQTVHTAFASYQAHYTYANHTLTVTRILKLERFVVAPDAYPQLHRLALAVLAGQRQGVLITDAGDRKAT
jgi:hypothetical protein